MSRIKTVFVVVCWVAIVGLGPPQVEAACEYTVSIPGPGDIWNAGSSYSTQWFKSGTCSDRVDLHLIRDGEAVWTIGTNQPNNGIANWTIPSSMASALEYQIRVRDRDDSFSYGLSRPFTILNSSSCGYRITDPAEGAVWFGGLRHTIRWSRAGNCPSPVDLHLMLGRQQVVEIAIKASDIGSYTWEVPTYLEDGEYNIRIRDSSDWNAYDISPEFAVEEELSCSYQVTAPSGGDTWRMGDSRTLTWTMTGDDCGQYVDLALQRAGDKVLMIAEGANNEGSFVWSLPTDLTPADDYVVEVQDAEIESASGLSQAFTIEEGGGGANVYWFEIASHDEGQAGSVWRTDVVLKNLSEDEAEVEIKLHGTGGGKLESKVPGNAQGVFEDVIGLMGVEGKGWLEVTSDQPLIVSGRVYNSSDSGTFGQFLEGHGEAGGLAKGESGWLLQLRQLSDRYRTNIVFTNPDSESAAIRVQLFDSGGNKVHEYRVDLDPGALFQDIEPYARRAGKPDLGWGFALVEVLEGTAVLISASVVDSTTNDGTSIPVATAE